MSVFLELPLCHISYNPSPVLLPPLFDAFATTASPTSFKAGFEVYRRAALQRLGASASLLPSLPPPLATPPSAFNPYAASFVSTSGAHTRLHAHQPSITDRRLTEVSE